MFGSHPHAQNVPLNFCTSPIANTPKQQARARGQLPGSCCCPAGAAVEGTTTLFVLVVKDSSARCTFHGPCSGEPASSDDSSRFPFTVPKVSPRHDLRLLHRPLSGVVWTLLRAVRRESLRPRHVGRCDRIPS